MDAKTIPVEASSLNGQTPNGEANPFQYGWRYVNRRLPNGETDVDMVPLTMEDVLHPQEEDVISESIIHFDDRRYLCDVFNDRAARLRNGRVFSDMLIDWGVSGVRNHSPDLSVFSDLVHNPQGNFGTFFLVPSGGRCHLLLEIVSPHTRDNDVKRKLEEYHRVEVPLYIIVDQTTVGGPRKLRAYRRTPAQFEPVELDDRGRLHLEALGVILAIEDGRVVCYDPETGKAFPSYLELLRMEETAREQARQEAVARQMAEQRLRDLEAELRQLRGN